MPSVGMQMPQLYLRGSLCNKTMVNLNKDQKKELSDLVELIMNDPNLKPAMIEFRNALMRTIKGDYSIPESADQECMVAIWKAAAAAKFGWGDHEPNMNVIENEIERKKYFQTWIFNYLKQILRENKRPTFSSITTKFVCVMDLCKQEIVNNLRECEVNGNIIFCDVFMIPSNEIDNIARIKKMYFKKGINIMIEDDKITIDNTTGESEQIMVSSHEKQLIKTVSTSSDDDNSIQLPNNDNEIFEDRETISNFIDNLSDKSKMVIKIIMNPPADYVEKYGDKPIKKYIAEYLNLTGKEIKDIWFELRMVYCDTIGVPN